MNTTRETTNKAVQAILDMLDKQIVALQGDMIDLGDQIQRLGTEQAEIAETLQKLEEVRRHTVGMIDAREADREPNWDRNEALEALEAATQWNNDPCWTPITEEEVSLQDSKEEVDWNQVGIVPKHPVPHVDPNNYVFPNRQRLWGTVYGLMKCGQTSLSDMADELGWKQQKVRDCLRGLRNLGLVERGGRNTFYLAGSQPTLEEVDDGSVFQFSSRQWRWETAYKLILRGHASSGAIALKLGHGWTVQQVSEMLWKLKMAGLIAKRPGNCWVATSKKVEYYSPNK